MTQEEQLGVDELFALTLPDHADLLAALPDPASSSLVAATEAELAEAVNHFRQQLMFLLREKSLTFDDGELHIVTRKNAATSSFWTLVLIVGSYYGYSAYRYAEKATPFALGELLGKSKFEPPKEADNETVSELITGIQLLTTVNLLMHHETCLFGLLAAAAVDEMGFQSGELTEKYDADLTAIEALDDLYEGVTNHVDEARQLLEVLLGFALRYRMSTVKKRHSRRQQESQDSVRNVGLKELRLLSVRNEIVIEKYGVKRVERVFEQKLALIFQSLGFTVVSARPGESGADLLCVARSDRFTFLVDAKSSKGPYALPKADQRAIRDYVSEFSSDLSDLPSLAFVLIVGGKAAGTVPAKLEELEASAGVPVKFMPIGLVVKLRETLPGPVLPKQFREAVIHGDPVLDKSVVDASRAGLEKLTSTYATFVDGLKKLSSS
jgi:hypothetical protein